MCTPPNPDNFSEDRAHGISHGDTVAWWLDLSERGVMTQVEDGSLDPVRWHRGKPLFTPDLICQPF